jgi:arylsulfatase A-like enzyme
MFSNDATALPGICRIRTNKAPPGAGDMADAMADIDYNVGLILDELDKSGIRNNTIVIWCGDNGAELRRPWRGNPGPWRGYYNSAMEGGVRSPCVIRWPRPISGRKGVR